MNYSAVIEDILAGNDLGPDQAQTVMDEIMDGNLDEARVAGVLVALRAKGETPGEIAGFARSMRRHASSFELADKYRPLVDTCGTGGDKVETINISTIAALVAAAGGARVAKHGNRSVSSSCGSADLLEALGVQIELEPQQVKKSIEEVGIGFMYAPKFHAAMKHAIGPRKSLGIRTVFNLLGPLTNPAGADRQLLGVFAPRWVLPVAEALAALGVEKALVVHGMDGMDEISLSAPTRFAEVNKGKIDEGEFHPSDFELNEIDISEIAGGSVDKNTSIARRLFEGEASGPVNSIVAVNAGAVLYLAGGADSLAGGVKRAKKIIEEGRVEKTVRRLVEFTQKMAEKS